MDTLKHKPILIIAKPGLMRNSLLAYLRALIGNQPLGVTDDLATARKWLALELPQLVLVDSDLSELELVSTIQYLRADQPTTQVIALVDSLQQQQMCLAIGATHALLKGFLDEQLQTAVLQIVGQAV